MSLEAAESVDLTVTGMTCTSCAARIERRLNKVPGVSATVNYATSVAHVEHASTVSVDALVATIEATGYRAIAPSEAESGVVDAIERHAREKRKSEMEQSAKPAAT
jgi:Cu+-exporting ATPase